MDLNGRFSVEGDVSDGKRMESLAYYVARQLDSLFPSDGIDPDINAITKILPTAIDRLKPILRTVRCFNKDLFHYHHSLQYSVFLYLLANEQWRNNSEHSLSDRLFLLNRALNSIDLFYSIEMPDVFFISHGLGTVLGNAKYGNRLVVFQNVTVGRVGEMKPIIGNNVVLYPGAVVTGRTVVGNNSIVSAGTILHNETVPDNTIVKITNGGQLVFKKNTRNYIDLYFDI